MGGFSDVRQVLEALNQITVHSDCKWQPSQALKHVASLFLLHNKLQSLVSRETIKDNKSKMKLCSSPLLAKRLVCWPLVTAGLLPNI